MIIIEIQFYLSSVLVGHDNICYVLPTVCLPGSEIINMTIIK